MRLPAIAGSRGLLSAVGDGSPRLLAAAVVASARQQVLSRVAARVRNRRCPPQRAFAFDCSRLLTREYSGVFRRWGQCDNRVSQLFAPSKAPRRRRLRLACIDRFVTAACSRLLHRCASTVSTCRPRPPPSSFVPCCLCVWRSLVPLAPPSSCFRLQPLPYPRPCVSFFAPWFATYHSAPPPHAFCRVLPLPSSPRAAALPLLPHERSIPAICYNDAHLSAACR